MTNRNMVRGGPDGGRAGARTLPEPTAAPAMPAPEDGATPTTREEPVDSPQPNASAKRGAPPPGEHGLSAER